MFGINKMLISFGLHRKKGLREFTEELKIKYDGYESTMAKKSETYTKAEVDSLIATMDDIKIHVNVYADLPTTYYDSPANTKPVNINDLAYVNNASAGLFGLVNRKPAGTYKFDGSVWVVSYDYSSIIAAINDVKLTWTYYVNTWTEKPSLVATLSNGKVYSYINGSVTNYRFVPTIYNPTEDAFYSTFANNVLTNKIVSRA